MASVTSSGEGPGAVVLGTRSYCGRGGSAERAEHAHRRTELGDDRFMNSHVPAAAGRPQSLDRQQARGALPERVVGQLIGTGQVRGPGSSGSSGQVTAGIFQQPAGNGDIGSDALQLPGEQLPDPVTPGPRSQDPV